MRIDNEPHRLYDRAKAEKLEAELNSQGDDWRYKAVHCPNGTGLSFIEAYDENGEFVARM